MEIALDRNTIVSQLTKMPHGKLSGYMRAVLPVAYNDPELLAHMLPWNLANSQIRDVKVAFPVLALRGTERDFTENALAALLSLGPREVVRGLQFNSELKANAYTYGVAGTGNKLQRAVERYLRIREENIGWFNRTALSNRTALKTLYRWFHVQPGKYAQDILFDHKYPYGTAFAAIRDMRMMEPPEIAAAIINHRIPMQVAIGAANKIKDERIALALLETMSAAELDNNMALLKRLGITTNSKLRVAYLQARERTKSDKRANILKPQKAAEIVSDDEELAKSLVKISEDRLKAKTIDGSWAVLADASQSMHSAIELGRQTAALIASRVSGKVHLLFFNTAVRAFDVTGKTYDEIAAATKYVAAQGATCPGVGLQWLWQYKHAVDGIALVTDGGENRQPTIIDAYHQYANVMQAQPTIYELYIATREPDTTGQLLERSGFPFTRYDITGADYYSLPSVIDLLRVNKYSLLDQIMATELLTLDTVLRGGGVNEHSILE